MIHSSRSARLYREDLAVSGQHNSARISWGAGLYREDLAVSGQLIWHIRLVLCKDYTERIWRYQDNRVASSNQN